ncbi:hypothetical protein Dtox_3707 [Desulfofarcimen acetoxidans DSM 771]|uniref:Uncharacterized protein n=1 Tax=Desulfofarcimen acetoxidans (strain ATCC 49208 / DSM 771 / KCTC 5769 / VKM B-1644 / 5575) TaxID=485916 RepID=C8VWQ1_DESAS|nr:hypothetical protein [Desulfofarcimen acetoxidans]ACV64415.1 hypothetical protein Dtox_3707 [Desulfofarcimen acetoxidans DSM 771]
MNIWARLMRLEEKSQAAHKKATICPVFIHAGVAKIPSLGYVFSEQEGLAFMESNEDKFMFVTLPIPRSDSGK